jgi:signal transduction histidine kinase
VQLGTRALLFWGFLLTSVLELSFMSRVIDEVQQLRDLQQDTIDFYRDGSAVVIELSFLARDTDSAKIHRMKAVEAQFNALDCCDGEWRSLSEMTTRAGSASDLDAALVALRTAIHVRAEAKYAAVQAKKQANAPLVIFALVATFIVVFIAFLFVLYVILLPVLRLTRSVENVGLGGRFDFEKKAFDPTEIAALANSFSDLLGRLQQELSERETALKETKRRAERAAMAQAARYQEIIEGSGSPIFTLDADGLVTSWNKAITDMTRIPARDALGRRFDESFLSTDDRTSFQQELARVQQGEAPTAIRLGLLGRGVSPVNLLLTLSVVGLHSEGDEGVTCLGQPVDKFLQDTADKLERQGGDQFTSLAASAAHQVNQPLHTMRLYLANAKNRLRVKNFQSEPLKEKLEGIDRELTRVDAIMERLRDLGRVAEPLSDGFEAGQVLDRCVEMITPICAEYGIAVVSALDISGLRTKGHPLIFEKAIVAILENAQDAIKETGRGSGTIRVDAIATSDLMHIAISDDGVGLSSDIAGKVFEPFFTTHTDQYHLGLGLTLAEAAVKASSGDINLNREDQLTSLTITLPVLATMQDLEDLEAVSRENASI